MKRAVTCRNCLRGTLRQHCGNAACKWHVCDLCEMTLDPKRGRVLPRQRTKR